MEQYELQKLRDLPIEGVAERLGLRVSRHKCLCPFHEDKHPSLTFHVGRNTFRCFVCGASGGTIDLVMRHRRVDFKEACRWLAGECGYVPTEHRAPACTTSTPAETTFDAKRYERFFEHPWLNEEAQRFLYDERRIDPRVVRWCRLSSWRDKRGTDWLQIPYYDQSGKLIGVQNRRLGAPGVTSPDGSPSRFRFPYGSRCVVYNLPVLNRLTSGESLYITEGCSDCWAMLSSGHKAIAIPSATLLKPDIAAMLRELADRMDVQMEMYPDQDAPGERLFLQLKEVLPNIVHHQLPQGCKDFGEWWKQLKMKNEQ